MLPEPDSHFKQNLILRREIINYVLGERVTGKGLSSIRQELIDQGYDEDYIDETFDNAIELESLRSSKRRRARLALVMMLLVISIASIIFGIYFNNVNAFVVAVVSFLLLKITARRQG